MNCAFVRFGKRGSFSISAHPTGHRPAQSLDRERLLPNQPLIPQEAGEDAQPVSAFLGLTPIRVEDAQLEVASLAVERAMQDAVRADAVTAMTDAFDLGRIQIGLGYDQVVIP